MAEQRDNSNNDTPKLPVLAAVATAAAPAWAEGKNVPLSVDLAGTLRSTAGGGGPGGGLTDAELRASAVPVSGPLTDAQLRAVAVPVSGPLTDAQLRAVAVPVSGTVTATGPLTDAQLRASAVPVSGPLTDAQLRATPVPVSGTVTANAGTNLNTSALALEATQGTGNTRIGDLTEAAPASDTASSGLNGRLQRIAQRLTSLIALLPAALVGGRLDTNIGAWLGSTAPTVGQKTMANSLPVALASDQTLLPAVAEQRAATLAITATAAVNTASTATLPAAGAGLFHYITRVELVKLYNVVGIAAGAGVIVTTTNLPGNPAYTTEQIASVAGTATKVINDVRATPLKSSVANTATTFVAPLQLQTIWRWNIEYFTAA